MKKEILLVDDDRLLLKTLSAVLEEAGYAVRTVTNGVRAVEEIRWRRPDLVLLDVMMPKVDGFDTCRRLREGDAALPILFLTALATPEDEVRALGAGGDGYIVKTEPDEILLARIAATLRSRSKDAADASCFAFGDWQVDAASLTMRSVKGQVVPIYERELYLLRLFARHPNEVLTRDMLETRLWGPDDDVTSNTLSVLIYAVRKKLGSASARIRSVRGVGYAYRP